MNLVPVEAPSAREALTRETIELRNASLGIVPARDRLQVGPNHLINTLPQRFGFLPGESHELVFDGQSDIHEHIICAHILCVNSEAFCALSPSRRWALATSARPRSPSDMRR